ncbi:CoA transferase [Novosphingobium guangzhouense]|uniref:Acyl-CoA transferase n=1 Tax=Novosphingobium guangzhouense TaxID=1850347 RepID=A0A2K2G1W6_9SPHN|nr:CoA transferase [Novosphingobium guangzhouense]PNU04992.1 acyl-CoA transferase [Novosphingobium guangzhouense]
MSLQADLSVAAPAIPLARWADRQLRAMHATYGLPRIDGSALMGERGDHGGYVINGTTSAGIGGSRLMRTKDGGWFALTLIREIDRELLPALFGDAAVNCDDWTAIAAAVLQHDCADLVRVGRVLGLPVAGIDEIPASPAIQFMQRGPNRYGPNKDGPIRQKPLVIDLSAIWAGPLAGHLLWQAGMEVIKVESLTRPDLIRRDDPATFERINQGKASVLIDFADEGQKAALVSLIRGADIVIESSRPRALRQLGIDADALVETTPGLVWLSITGHGASGEPANWVGIGNDCGVAAGLTRAMADAGGGIGYVGDAIADPLTGIVAAREGLAAYQRGTAIRIGLSMSGITALALHEEQKHDRAMIDSELRAWGLASGCRFPPVSRREIQGTLQPIGADTERYLGAFERC